jgi:hypothetical protein
MSIFGRVSASRRATAFLRSGFSPVSKGVVAVTLSRALRDVLLRKGNDSSGVWPYEKNEEVTAYGVLT